jgi:hypothetical protein
MTRARKYVSCLLVSISIIVTCNAVYAGTLNGPVWAKIILDKELWNRKAPWPSLEKQGPMMAQLTGSLTTADLGLQEGVSNAKLSVKKLIFRYGEGQKTIRTQNEYSITYYRYGPLALGIQNGSAYVDWVVAPMDFFLDGFVSKAKEALQMKSNQDQDVLNLSELVGNWRNSNTNWDDDKWIITPDGEIINGNSKWNLAGDRAIKNGLTEFRVKKVRANFMNLKYTSQKYERQLVRGNDKAVKDLSGLWVDQNGIMSIRIGLKGDVNAELNIPGVGKNSYSGSLNRTTEGFTMMIFYRIWLLEKVSENEMTASPTVFATGQDSVILNTISLRLSSR